MGSSLGQSARFWFVVGLLIAAPLLHAADGPALVPLPQTVQSASGAFELKRGTRILVDGSAREAGNYLAERLRKATGLPFKVATSKASSPPKGEILVTTKEARLDGGPEGYTLGVNPESVVLRAADSAGLFYGVQTLLQLLPPEVFASQPARSVNWQLPCLTIDDAPRFKWRGFLIDSARHFFTKNEIKQVLDTLALHKLNTFHWHLTDDQGWRIEIKKYPRLTQVGAWRKTIGFGLDPKSTATYGPDGRYGGYYTQADIREILQYAKVRHITIVPEIEMPGHASAALTAYPQFSCSGGPYSTEATEGVFAGVYCVGNDGTFEFLDGVLAEVAALFPGKYIHIGGDEVPKDNWKKCPKCQARMKQEGLTKEEELQSYFIRRIEKIVNRHGHSLMGWSEILQGGLAPNAAVMDWIGGAVEAASAGHDVVMSPTDFCYLDYYQSTNQAAEPKAIGAYLPLSKVYQFDPLPANLDPKFRAHILGAQGNLWTEYVPNLKHAQYMMFPRLAALAEAEWSPQSARNYEDFQRRLRVHLQRLEFLGVNYRKGSGGQLGE